MAASLDNAPVPGSAAWWSARTTDPAVRRPRPGGITLAAIFDAALQVVESDGHAALTMRRVAEQLGTGPASLYRHVNSREELIVLLVDHVVGSSAHRGRPAADWRQEMELGARHLRASLMRHRAVVPLIVGAQMLGPNSMTGRERALSVLLDAGFPPQIAIRGFMTIQHFVVANVQLDVRDAARTRTERRRVEELFASQEPERFPNLVGHAQAFADHTSDDEFEFGLAALLHRLDAGVPPSRAGNQANAKSTSASKTR